MWACDHIGLKPDMITTGKGIGGGFPLSVAIMRDDIAETVFNNEDPVTIVALNDTGGAPFGCATGNAVLDSQWKTIWESQTRMGKFHKKIQ